MVQIDSIPAQSLNRTYSRSRVSRATEFGSGDAVSRTHPGSEVFDIRGAINGIYRDISGTARKRGLGFRSFVGQEVPDRLVGHWGHLSQILRLLLGGAVTFTEEGQVSLEVTLIEQTNVDTTLCFSVFDTGPGLSLDRLSAIYDVISMTDKPRPSRDEGVILGLAMAGRLSEMMGGYLFAQSREGEGTAFHLTVTLQNQETKSAKVAG